VLDALEQAQHERRPVRGGGLVHHSDRGSNTCRSNRRRVSPRPASSPRPAASATVTTTRSPRRSTGSAKPRASGGAAHGGTLKPLRSPHSNGSTGSIIEDCWSRSETSPRPGRSALLYAKQRARHSGATQTKRPPANLALFTTGIAPLAGPEAGGPGALQTIVELNIFGVGAARRA
jgi:hypothetical protein